MTEPAIVGIDIGTSPCCISVWNGSQRELWKQPIHEMVKKYSEASEDHNPSIGVKSKISLFQDHTEDTIFHDDANPFLMYTLDIKVRPSIAASVNKVWRSKDRIKIFAKFMRGLISMIKTQLKRPIRNVVFTVPNSFGRFQLHVIRSACLAASLNITLLPQPTAVALLYAQQQLQASASHESERIALIFNMDAGYCDVVVIVTSKTKFRIKASIGSAVGAEDLLGNMMSHLLPDSEKIFKKHVHEDREIKSMALLRGTVQKAITQLSSQTSVKVDLELGDDVKIPKVMTREEFEDVNKEVFEKCERLIIQCLQDAKVEVKNINDVIIVGGCWNIPKVKNLVTKLCKRDEFYRGMNPLVVALQGAVRGVQKCG